MRYALWKEWRKRHPEYRNSSRKRYYRKTAHSTNHNRRWSAEELELITEHKIPDTQLSLLLGRSVGSIQAQRCLIKATI